MGASPVRGQDLRVDVFLAMAERIKATHEQVAVTMAKLAERGGPDAERRRRLAERSLRFAEMEARHISAWKARQGAHTHG